MAGSTVITWSERGKLIQESSSPKRDADEFLMGLTLRLKPKRVFIDAPISLPFAYYDKGNDFHFRKCDRELNAMSPMFLGGLTARAMKISKELKNHNIMVYETYPSGLVKNNPILKSYYHKKDLSCISKLKYELQRLSHPIKIPKSLFTIHHLDSLLAWISGYRYENNSHLEYGSREEGIIII